MEVRQSLLDYAMNRQTKSTKEYPLIQELLFHKTIGREDNYGCNRNIDQSKETGKNR